MSPALDDPYYIPERYTIASPELGTDDINIQGPRNRPTNGFTDEAPKETAAEKPFSWTQPHPIFVIVLVGADEQPFGLQKDFLCERSEFFRKHFEENAKEDTLEHIVKLPETSAEVFGLAQSFLYTGRIADDNTNVTSYESLVSVWKLGHNLAIQGLCEHALEAMVECRRTTGRIPATPLLIQVWRDTPEGSSIRVLLLSWAAEYMRSSDARAEFAKSLPQEVLSELVVTMSSFETKTPPAPPSSVKSPAPSLTTGLQKNVHYLDDQPGEETLGPKKRRQNGRARREILETPPPRAPRRRSGPAIDSTTFTTQQKLDFCADLLSRMLSGPGFWTRLVGPFREPVSPVEDGVPDYFDKVKKPMDLSTIKKKMDQREYATEEDFLVDVRQIFENCFTYWNKGDPMWAAGEKLQRTFEEKYSQMNKWISKLGGEEGQ